MSRITYKLERPETMQDYGIYCAHNYHAINKLGKLEDLMEKYSIPDVEYLEKCIQDHDKYGETSEEIGCSLEVLVRAMTSEIYYDIASGTGKVVRPFLVVNDDDMFVFDTMDGTDYIYLNDYKKTWWLKENRKE